MVKKGQVLSQRWLHFSSGQRDRYGPPGSAAGAGQPKQCAHPGSIPVSRACLSELSQLGTGGGPKTTKHCGILLKLMKFLSMCYYFRHYSPKNSACIFFSKLVVFRSSENIKSSISAKNKLVK